MTEAQRKKIAKAIEALRPKKGSGITAVTITTRDASVTLNADGTTTREKSGEADG